MRTPLLFLALVLTIPVAASPQAAPRTAIVEKFDVAGLPKAATNEEEKQILLMLQYHKRGDLKDATRIHMMLAEYYKARGEKARAADCAKQAAEAWEAAEMGLRVSAGSPGSPPFETKGLFKQAFGYTDELGVAHRWEFFDDGTYAHAVSDPDVRDIQPPTELGFYAVAAGQIRLWQQDPAVDRTVTFSRVGRDGKDGARMNGVMMKPVK